jgi:hypothetical protein
MLSYFEYIPYDLRQFIPTIILGLIVLPPMFIILRRTGKSLWWLVLCSFPPILGLLVVLYILAFSRWPKLPD